jgi:hypothetical protein
MLSVDLDIYNRQKCEMFKWDKYDLSPLVVYVKAIIFV